MLMASFQKEWQVFRRDDRLSWLLITLLAMMVLGIATSTYQYQQRQALKTEAQGAERARWDNQGEKNPHSAAHYGIYLFKPDTPLSAIDPGLSQYLGDITFLEAHKRNNAAFAASQDSIELQRLGMLSPATILQLLLPLFVILTGFGFFAAEREQGTLRMLLLSGRTPKQLFLQKSLALISFSVLFLIPIAIYIGLLLFTKGELDQTRFWGIACAYSVYLLLWILLTLAVSLFAKTARLSLTLLLLFWAMTSLIIPKVAMDISAQAHPTISAQEFYARMESDLYTPERLQAIEQFKADTLKQYGANTTDELPFNWAGAELLFGESYSNRIFDNLFNQQLQQLQQQEHSYQAFAVSSPFVAIQVVSSALATTDWYHHYLFSTSAEQYRRDVIHTLNANVRDHKGHDHQGDNDLWQSIPAFSYQFPQATTIATYYTTAIISFAGWFLVMLLASGVAIRRLSQEGNL